MLKWLLNGEGIDINEDIKNVFKVTDGVGTILHQSEVTTPVSKKGVNEGELKITKVVQQPQIQPDGAVEYELLVENLNETPFNEFSVEDYYPAGFRYVEGSSKIRKTQGGQFSGGYQSIEPAEVSTRLVYKPLNLEAQEKLSIRYILKASIGVSFGQYKNIAYAVNEGGGKISNEGGAIVSVLGDKLFDTTSITGKVFEDHNGNGYQSDATAKDIVINMPIPNTAYVANSTRLMLGERLIPLKPSPQSPFNKGLKISEVWGQSNNRHTHASQATVMFKAKTADNYPLSVTSSTGSDIRFDKHGKFTKVSKGNLKKGLSSEDLYVTRNIYKQADGYLWEIIIENHGQYDDGIPGVRLITPEGFKIETDGYGRYHVPDRWVLDKKGRNYVIKVDSDSLPAGMNIISENPKVLRITPNKLNKFNFSAQKSR